MMGFMTPFVVVITMPNVTRPKFLGCKLKAYKIDATINGVQQHKNARTMSINVFVIFLSLYSLLVFPEIETDKRVKPQSLCFLAVTSAT